MGREDFRDQIGFKNKKKNQVIKAFVLIIPIFDQYQITAMKHPVKYLLPLLLMLVVPSACKKSAPPPDYPELVGSWSGSTSQSNSISLYVENKDGTLNLISIRFIIFFDGGGQQTLNQYSTEGIASVNNRYFKIPLGTGIYGQAYIDGTFNTGNMTLTGTFKCYNPSNPGDFTSGTFVASKAK
jgi:hypothetical protein